MGVWPILGPRYHKSGCWGAIVSVGDVSLEWEKVLSKGASFVVGDGRDVKFLINDRVGVGTLCELFPRVFRVMSNKESAVSNYYEGREGYLMK